MMCSKLRRRQRAANNARDVGEHRGASQWTAEAAIGDNGGSGGGGRGGGIVIILWLAALWEDGGR